MIYHIVMFRMKNREDIPRALEKLATLRERVPEIESFTIGRDFIHEGNSYDIAEIATFRTREDFLRYKKDPYHGEIREYICEKRETSAKIDMEI